MNGESFICNLAKDDGVFGESHFKHIIKGYLDGYPWSDKDRNKITNWFKSVRSELDKKTSPFYDKSFINNFLNERMFFSLLYYFIKRNAGIDEGDFNKVKELSKLFNKKEDDRYLFFITIHSDDSKLLLINERNLLYTKKLLRKMSSNWISNSHSRNNFDKNWSVYIKNSDGFNVSAYNGKSFFWWELLENIPEKSVKKWLFLLSNKDFRPKEDNNSCLKTIADALLSSSYQCVPFYKNIKDWDGTWEYRKWEEKIRENRAKYSKKWIGRETPQWGKNEIRDAKRIRWHNELLNPIHVQSLPIFEPSYVISNEFWEAYAKNLRKNRLWGQILFDKEWVMRLDIIGDINGSWRNDENNLLARSVASKLRIASENKCLDKEFFKAYKKIKSNAEGCNKALSYWEHMRLEWELEAKRTAKPIGMYL